MLSHDMEVALDRVANSLFDARHAVALVGAGLSVESGIPPFRGPGGLWTKFGEPPLLSYKEFAGDPLAWWRRRLQDEVEPGNPVYELKVAVDRAVPNPGHLSLTQLESLGALKSTITQNVDNLHREAGSVSLIEIHGNRTWLRCTGCGGRRPREGFALGALPPKCPDCGGVIKLDTVMFGEPIPPVVLQECKDQTERCDLMLLVGTSGTVNPAAQLPLLARAHGAMLIEVNPMETALSAQCDLSLHGPAGELLPLLTVRVQRLMAMG